MNILVAPNSMKGSLDAFTFADIVEKAFLNCSDKFKVRKIPVADGGDFTAEILGKQLGAEIKTLQVRDPLGREINSRYFFSGKTAVIEMAEASGMKLLNSNELNPLKTSSFGTGQLIRDAVNHGCDNILLSIGGSATVDGGTGMLQALGFQFFDKKNNLLNINGKELGNIYHVHKPVKLPEVSFKIICDVDNPLLGENGAAVVFGPQKGATHEMVEILENGLINWSEIIEKETGFDFSEKQGSGAAGGIAVPLMAFFNAEIVAGADFVLTSLNFDQHIRWADLVVTGEGKIDSQTLNKKAPFVVAQHVKKYSKPVLAIAGQAQPNMPAVFDKVYSIVNNTVSVSEAIGNVNEYLYHLAFNLAQNIKKSWNDVRSTEQ